MPEIFLSYRRQDNDHALSLYLWLIKKYGRESVFWDRKDIDPGLDFAEAIGKGIDRSAAFIALIGKGWTDVADAEGRRKLDSPDDWVRRETSAAMRRGILVLPVLGSGASMPAPKDLPPDIEGLTRLQALSMMDMRFNALLAESLSTAGINERAAAGPEEPASKVAARAGNLLRRQAARLQVRAKELIRENQFDRAFEELNEGTELMMALLDLVPGEAALDLQLGYMYAALGQHFDYGGDPSLADRYMDLAVGIFQRVQDEVSSDKDASGELASAIKGLGEVYYKRGDLDAAIRSYRQALEIEPLYSYAWHDLFGALYAQAQRGRINLAAMRLALTMTKETSLGPTGRHAGLGEEYLAQLDQWMRECEERAEKNPHLEVGAEARASAAIERNPGDPELYFLRARARAAKLDTPGAIEDYTAAIAHGRQGPEAWLERAYLHLTLDHEREAEQDFTAALDHGDASASTRFYRGRTRVNLDDARGAESDFTAAIDAGYTAAYPHRAAARGGLGDFEGAEADLSKAIEFGEAVADAHLARARLRAGREDHAGAAEDFSAAIENGRETAEIYGQLGDAQLAMSDGKDALAAFEKAIELGAADFTAYFRRAMARAMSGDTAGTAGDLEKAIDLDATRPFLFYMLGKMRVLNGEAAKAEESLSTALERGYAEGAAYYWRARARVAQENYPGAEQDFTTAIEQGQDDGDIYYRRAVTRMMQRELAAAEADLTKATGKDFEKEAFTLRAMVRYMMGNAEGAYDDCTEALARGSDVAQIYRIRAHTGARLKRLEHAEADCARAAEMEPGDFFGRTCWAEVYMAKGDFAEAVQSYESALEAEDSVTGRFSLGLALLLDGRVEDARAAYGEAVNRADAEELQLAREELDHWTKERPAAMESARAIQALLNGGQTSSAGG